MFEMLNKGIDTDTRWEDVSRAVVTLEYVEHVTEVRGCESYPVHAQYCKNITAFGSQCGVASICCIGQAQKHFASWRAPAKCSIVAISAWLLHLAEPEHRGRNSSLQMSA